MIDTNPATTPTLPDGGSLPNAITVQYDDANRIIVLTLPGGSTVTIGDEGKSLVLQDASGNRVGLDPSGIRLDSPKDIVFSAKGSIRMEAVGNIALHSKQDLQAQGVNVNLSAQIGFAAKGNATSELSASGQTVVKGAMVMIN